MVLRVTIVSVIVRCKHSVASSLFQGKSETVLVYTVKNTVETRKKPRINCSSIGTNINNKFKMFIKSPYTYKNSVYLEHNCSPKIHASNYQWRGRSFWDCVKTPQRTANWKYTILRCIGTNQLVFSAQPHFTKYSQNNAQNIQLYLVRTRVDGETVRDRGSTRF